MPPFTVWGTENVPAKVIEKEHSRKKDESVWSPRHFVKNNFNDIHH